MDKVQLALDQLEVANGALERTLSENSLGLICGVDEAGRGPLAGPVVAAAVVYKECDVLARCKDSKALTHARRLELFPEIKERMQHGVGICSASEIDELNIRQASLTAMVRAIKKLTDLPDIVLVDGRDPVPMKVRSIPIIKGDARVATIGAASILAKVTRDLIMLELDTQFPQYGFAAHKGYPTRQHREAIRKYGCCKEHRRSYRGVREFV